MVKRQQTALIVVTALLGGFVLGWSLRSQDPLMPAPRQDFAGTRNDQPAIRFVTKPPPKLVAAKASPESGTLSAEERAAFNERARQFFAQSPGMSPEERDSQAQALAEELSRLEHAGGMSAGETFLLHAALIRETEPDPAQQMEKLEALKEHYARNTRRLLADAGKQSDPEFDLYKVREREIVTEVMAMERVPDGLGREEYLRRRLQREREELLGESRPRGATR
jgi:uncharacterized protein YoaH (UPF0181 family)